MARSLLTIGQIHRERPPVFSVTSESTPTVSFQAAPPKPARSDLASTDSFAALVDSNTAADTGNNDRAATAAPPQRRSDDTPAAADNSQSPATTAADPSAS